MLLHQSDLAAYARCPAQYGYKRAGWPDKVNSASAYGSVVHHALHALERDLALARQDMDPHSPEYTRALREATERAVRTFVHYWNPLNIEAITEPVPPDGWLPRQGYNEMRQRGVDTIMKYADLIRYDDHELLGLEYGFVVPVPGTWDEDLGEPHLLGGSIDRLATRHYSRRLVVAVDDYKTGREQTYLRHNLQFTAYLMATTLPEFWTGYRGEDGFGQERGMELYERFRGAGRRGTWINLRTFKFQDAGWRGPKDYARFALAVDQLAAAVKADIFPLTISGEACKYCPFRDNCGGVGVPKDSHGDPREEAA